MTKTYKVIPIKDYGVVVDEKGEMKNGVYFPKENTIGEFNATIIKGLKTVQPEWAVPIIGSIGKRLDGVPLIELVDDVKNLKKKAMKDLGLTSYYSPVSVAKIEGWIKGYKVNTNKYSEEDMILFANYAELHPEHHKRKITSEVLQDYNSEFKKQPIPTEVELEIATPTTKDGKTTHIGYWELVIHNRETNTISPVNYKI